MILALETATDVCSVAFQDGEGMIHERRTAERSSHSENLFIFIEELMAEHRFAVTDLEAILVSEGPGSYTGLRISASAVKGLLFRTGIPLYSVNTLAGFARSAASANIAFGTNRIHSVIDARRVHLYHQAFGVKKDEIEARTKVDILPIAKVNAQLGDGDVLIGTGIDRLDEDALEGVTVLGKEHVSAQSLIALYNQGESPFVVQQSPDSFEPNYYTSRQAEE